jgi:pSer/pThr/pTyr-binding forkhead associated (FHA) protein
VFGPDGPYLLSHARVRVGRGRANELQLQDPSVSREHAELLRTGDGRGWRVRDLGSTNGVAVNGAKVQEQALALGDTITFGSCSVRFDRWAGGDD